MIRAPQSAPKSTSPLPLGEGGPILSGRVRGTAATRSATGAAFYIFQLVTRHLSLVTELYVPLGVGMSGMGRAAELARKHLPV